MTPGAGGVSITALTPSHRLHFDTRPGAEVRARLRVSNSSGQRQVVSVWPTDITTAAAGGIEFPLQPGHEIDRWMHLSRHTVALPPGGHRDVVLTARVPDRSSAGERFAGVVATRRTGAHVTTQTGVRIRTVIRLALPVSMRLPNPGTRSVTAQSAHFFFDALGTGIALRLGSPGTERIRSTILNLRLVRDGRIVLSHHAQLADIFPGTTFEYRIPWEQRQPATGDYRLVGTVAPQGAPTVDVDLPLHFGSPQERALQSVTRTAPLRGDGTPAWVVAVAAAATALMVAFAVAYVRLRRRMRAS